MGLLLPGPHWVGGGGRGSRPASPTVFPAGSGIPATNQGEPECRPASLGWMLRQWEAHAGSPAVLGQEQTHSVRLLPERCPTSSAMPSHRCRRRTPTRAMSRLDCAITAETSRRQTGSPRQTTRDLEPATSPAGALWSSATPRHRGPSGVPRALSRPPEDPNGDRPEGPNGDRPV